MFLINWYRQWKEVQREYTTPKVCETCEAFKITVEQLRTDNQRLLDRILIPPTVESKPNVDNVTPIKRFQHTPWKVRQQMLEENDRHKAKLMKEAPKPSPISADTTIEELEDELLNAEKQRESKSSGR